MNVIFIIVFSANTENIKMNATPGENKILSTPEVSSVNYPLK